MIIPMLCVTIFVILVVWFLLPRVASLLIFFFQAEDGIRYRNVTGVQTCALPICVPWVIATSGRRESAQPMIDMLGIAPDVPVVTRDQVEHAKPDPDLFLAAAERLGV